MIIKKFYATMDWWKVAEQPLEQKNIVNLLAKCRVQWELGGKSSTEARDTLQKYLRSKFLVRNVYNYKEIFGSTFEDGQDEVASSFVNLIDMDFSTKPIPLCKSEAEYNVLIKSQFSETDLTEWQDRNGYFYDAVTFYWDFSQIERYDLDLTFGSHSGIECIVKD
jgi:hypothetical protein